MNGGSTENYVNREGKEAKCKDATEEDTKSASMDPIPRSSYCSGSVLNSLLT